MINKRGQFYLIAAIVIIGIVIGFATLTNFFSRGLVDEKKVYFLSKELSIEGTYVIDYSTFKGTDAEILLGSFAEKYGQYAGENREIYFVFGDKDTITVATYEEISVGSISVTGGGNPIAQEIIERGFSKKVQDRGTGTDLSKVTVQVTQDGRTFDYEFDLKPGENFYFVISQDIEGRGRITLDEPSEMTK
jgi:hypothetical protein